eukprot:UN3383
MEPSASAQRAARSAQVRLVTFGAEQKLHVGPPTTSAEGCTLASATPRISACSHRGHPRASHACAHWKDPDRTARTHRQQSVLKGAAQSVSIMPCRGGAQRPYHHKAITPPSTSCSTGQGRLLLGF